MAIAENLTGKIHEYIILWDLPRQVCYLSCRTSDGAHEYYTVESSPSDFLPILYIIYILVSFPQKITKPLFFTGVVPKEDPFPPSAHI